MKNSKGFTVVEGLLTLIIIGIIGGTGWYVYNSRSKADSSLNNSASLTNAASSSKKTSAQAQADNPYIGWKTYQSSYDRASFKYPSGWAIQSHIDDTYVPGSDHATLTSPSGKVIIQWDSAVSGIGGNCNDQESPDASDGNGCPYQNVTDKEKISGTSLYYVAGTSQYVEQKYSPWLSVQDGDGVLKSGSAPPAMYFKGDFGHYVSFIAEDSSDTDYPSSQTAKAFLDSAEAQQAKLILLSFSL